MEERKMKKVVKFGGSSLADAGQFKKAGDIIRAEESRRYVVPSAPGKRHVADTKVTDMLYHCYELAEQGEDFASALGDIRSRYEEIARGLSVTLDFAEEFEQIEKNFSAGAGKDYAASRGEYLNGKIMSAFLGFPFVDAADVISFDEAGNFLSEETNRKLQERLEAMDCAVIPGFYGARPDGRV